MDDGMDPEPPMRLIGQLVISAVRKLVRWGRSEAPVPPPPFKINHVH
jgi:hypothetical protein